MRRLDAEPVEREQVRLGPWLVSACGLGRDDRVEPDDDASGRALPELLGAVGDHADPHAVTQAFENVGRLGPGPKPVPHVNRSKRTASYIDGKYIQLYKSA